MNAYMVVLEGKHKGLSINLPHTQFVIGRDERCHLRPASTDVSRYHCAIARRNLIVQLCDLNSANGTFLNGRRVERIQRIHDGDVLEVGPLKFQFHITPAAGDEPASDTGLAALVRKPDADEEKALDASMETTIGMASVTDEAPAVSGRMPPRGEPSAVGGKLLHEYLFRRRQVRRSATGDSAIRLAQEKAKAKSQPTKPADDRSES
jgi:pSer/pThr/pTyr-binding forkhead associated (FHA) protein